MLITVQNIEFVPLSSFNWMTDHWFEHSSCHGLRLIPRPVLTASLVKPAEALKAEPISLYNHPQQNSQNSTVNPPEPIFTTACPVNQAFPSPSSLATQAPEPSAFSTPHRPTSPRKHFKKFASQNHDPIGRDANSIAHHAYIYPACGVT